MVYLHFPPSLTEEELMLQTKYEKLKRKKKALQNLKAPNRQESERGVTLSLGTHGGHKRTGTEGRDAREVARKLLKSGAIAAIQKEVRREEQASGFKRPSGLERKLERAERPVSGYQPFSATHPQQFMDQDPNRPRPKLYDTPVGALREEKDTRTEKLKEAPKEGNTIYVMGYHITEEFLRKNFSNCGKIINISMEIEKNQGFITFESKAAAATAISEFNGSVVSTIQLRVTYARRQPLVDPVTGAHSAAAWSSAASNNSQKGSYKDVRELVTYEEHLFE